MRPEHGETKTETRECKTETETKKLLWDGDQKLWDRDRDQSVLNSTACKSKTNLYHILHI